MTTHPSDSTPRTITRASQQGDIHQGGNQKARRDVAWHVLDEAADVRFLPSGTPLALRWRGSVWQVIGEPMTWSSSRSWWEPDTTTPETSAPVGQLSGRGSMITTRFWRFRAQTGPSSPVLEFDMSTNPGRDGWQGGWRLRRVAGTTTY